MSHLKIESTLLLQVLSMGQEILRALPPGERTGLFRARLKELKAAMAAAEFEAQCSAPEPGEEDRAVVLAALREYFGPDDLETVMARALRQDREARRAERKQRVPDKAAQLLFPRAAGEAK